MPQSDDDRSLYSAVKGVGQICSDRQKSNLTERAVKFKLNLTSSHSSSVKFCTPAAKNVSLWIFSKAAFSEIKSFGFSLSNFAKSCFVSNLACGILTSNLIAGHASSPTVCKPFRIALSRSCFSRAKINGRITTIPFCARYFGASVLSAPLYVKFIKKLSAASSK